MTEPLPAKLRWSSRKFWSMVALEVTATGLLMADLIESSEWVSVTLFLAGAYYAANVATEYVRK